jgi:phospholipid transport system transporter-binding protein
MLNKTGSTQVQLKAQANGWALTGDLSFASVPKLLSESQRVIDFSGNINISLKDIDHADSAGLALLLEWLDLSHTAGGNLSFSQLPKALLDIARASNVEALLPLVDSAHR